MRVCATDLERLSRLDATLPVDFFFAVYLPCDFAGEWKPRAVVMAIVGDLPLHGVGRIGAVAECG